MLFRSEKNLPFFEKLQINKVNVDSLFTILLPDNSLYPYNGKISVIDRAVDSQTGSIRVRLVFDNPKSILRVGMSCVVRVHNQETTPVLVMPSKAVVEQMGEYFVFTAKDSVINVSKDSLAKNPKADVSGKPRLFAHQKKVMVGQTIGPNVIIKSGVNEGDRIITDGVQTLHDGSPVTTANKVAPTQGGKH